MADFDRFRSFAERYVVERATHFTKGKEREDAWQATLDAKTIYANIARSAKDVEPEVSLPQSSPGQQAGKATMYGAALQQQGSAVGPPARPFLPQTSHPSLKQQNAAMRQGASGPPAAHGAPAAWGKVLSEAIRKFTGAGVTIPTSLADAVSDHIKNGGKIP